MSTGTPRYRWRLLRAAKFKLDGGSMFGLVPRVVWSKSAATDERGRIALEHNCLLLERADDVPSAKAALYAPKLVLIETGTGDKLDPKSRDIFELQQRSILDALNEADCAPESIGGVVVSHLHFDHAGGLTRLCRPGEKPDWKGPSTAGAEHGVKLSFPGAKVFVQAREYADAVANRSVMTRTYFREHVEPPEYQFVKVDSPRPWRLGEIPDRDALPSLPLEYRLTEVMPGIEVFLTPGHTWGQQAVKFTDVDGRTIVFTPDVMPTVQHVGAAYSLAYDVEPYTSMLTRHWLLEEAASRGWVLVLDHEPGNPVQRVRRSERTGWYELVPESV